MPSGAGAKWTVSVSWGFAVVVVRGVVSPREMETPMRTFLNWYKRADYTAYSFNTRPVARNHCQRPQVSSMRRARVERRVRRRRTNATLETTVTEYERHTPAPNVTCRWRIPDPAGLLDRVVIVKKPDPDLWKRIFSGPEDTCWAKEVPEGGSEGSTTHLGAPGGLGAPWWVVPTSAASRTAFAL
uniref:Uncharacterized protein n=1 Tax=Aegilops tauschii TaxID=37682 RepID=M8CGI2_AEGTA